MTDIDTTPPAETETETETGTETGTDTDTTTATPPDAYYPGDVGTTTSYLAADPAHTTATAAAGADARMDGLLVTTATLPETTGGTFWAIKFSTTHDVHAPFVPFAGRDRDPLAMLRAVRDVAAAAPGTAQTISRARVEKRYDAMATADAPPSEHSGVGRVPMVFFLVHGAYPVPSRAAANSKAAQFANPTYHDQAALDSVTDRAARFAWLDYYAAVGMHTRRDVLAHFGLTAVSSLGPFLTRHGYNWRHRRQAGRRRLARTWKLCYAWGASWPEVADAFGKTPGAVRKQTEDHAGDFAPPADPTASDDE